MNSNDELFVDKKQVYIYPLRIRVFINNSISIPCYAIAEISEMRSWNVTD